MVGGCPQAGMRPQCPGRDPCLPLPRSSLMPGLPPASQPVPCPLPASRRAASTSPEEESSPWPAAQLGSNNGKKRPRPQAKPWQRGRGNAHPWWWYLPKNTSSCQQWGAEELHRIGGRVVGCSPTPAALGTAPPRWALSPRVLAVRLQCQGPARPRTLCTCLPPQRAWLLAAGHRTLQSWLPASDMLLLGWWESRGRSTDAGAAPGVQRGRGLFTPETKTGEGGIKMKSSLASLRANGRASVRGGADPVPSRSTWARVRSQAAGLGVGGQPAAAQLGGDAGPVLQHLQGTHR